MSHSNGTDKVGSFGGTIVRSLLHRGRKYIEYFQWFDLDRMESTAFPVIGQRVLDTYTFHDASMLGPALIYMRDVPNMSPPQLHQLFSGNSAVQFDTAQRKAIEDDRNFVWPTDDEYSAGFTEIRPSGFAAPQRSSKDAVWNRAAEKGFKWIIARAITRSAGGFVEALVWTAQSPRVPDAELLAIAAAQLQAHGLAITDDLVELFDTHWLRPESGSIVFEIERISTLEVEAYLNRFAGSQFISPS